MNWLVLNCVLAKTYLPAPFPKNHDFSLYPASDAPPAPLPNFFTDYDFSKVPQIPSNTPDNSTSPTKCNPALDMSVNGTCNWSCNQCTRPTDYVQCPDQNQWGLTFDDGPVKNATDMLLDFMETRNVRSTFCVIGSRVKESPDLLLRAYQQGHQICIHSWSHRALTSQSTPIVVAELLWTMMIVEQVTGQRPRYYRPPMGDYDDRVRAIANAMGLKVIVWNYDTSDFQLNLNQTMSLDQVTKDAAGQVKVQLTNATSGVMALEHDNSNRTARVGTSVIQLLLANKLVPMPATECLGLNDPYLSSNITLPASTVDLPGIPDNAITKAATVSIPVPGATYTPTNAAWRSVSILGLVVLSML